MVLSHGMRSEKFERNKLIVKLIKNGWTYSKVANEMGFKSKGTVYDIIKRHKDEKSVRDLSTPR